MKKSLLSLAIFLLSVTATFAAVGVKLNGVNKGSATDINFTGSSSTTSDGTTVNIPLGNITTSITETEGTETYGATNTITSPLSGSVSGAVQVGSSTDLIMTGTGSLTGTGHSVALLGRNTHSGSGTIPLQIGTEGVLKNNGGGTVSYGAVVAANMNDLSGGSTYTLLAGFSPVWGGIAAPGSITTLGDFYSADDSAVTNIPSTRYSLINLDTGKIIYTAGKIGVGVTTPSGPLVVNHPAAQTIAADGTITADGCGTIKAIQSATGAILTNTVDTFTAPSASNVGCCMDVFNVGADNITLDDNAHFFAGGNVVLTQFDVVRVCSYGQTAWVRTGALVAN